MKITYLSHSGFIIECCDKKIIIDPFITGNPLYKSSEIDLNVCNILLTHGHGDHIGDAIKLSKEFNAPITATFELANYCSSQGAKVIATNMGAKLEYDWGTAVLVPASHSSSTPDGKYAGEPGGFIIELCGLIVYHAGDTGLHYDMKMIKEVYAPHIALLPIGGQYTMGIDEAVIAAHWLGVKHVIPMHYNTFTQINADPNIFAKKIKDKLSLKCTILQPGESKEFQNICKTC